MTTSLASMDLPEELGEAFYLLDYWLMIKGQNSGTPRRKAHTGQGVGEEHEASMVPEVHHSYQISVCSPTSKLSETSLLGFHGGFIT